METARHIPSTRTSAKMSMTLLIMIPVEDVLFENTYGLLTPGSFTRFNCLYEQPLFGEHTPIFAFEPGAKFSSLR